MLQAVFLVQVVLKQFESLSRNMFLEKELIRWRFLAFVFEVITLAVIIIQ